VLHDFSIRSVTALSESINLFSYLAPIFQSDMNRIIFHLLAIAPLSAARALLVSIAT